MINLISLCQNAEKIGISGHVRPDGDCVGSTMGLWQFLSKRFPKKRVEVRLERPADVFDFIPGVSEIVDNEEDVVYDVYFVVDSVPDRIGGAENIISLRKQRSISITILPIKDQEMSAT